MGSFPGAPSALVAAGLKWFGTASANALGHVPSHEDSLEIEFGLLYSPLLLQPSPDVVASSIAAELDVDVDDIQAFPKWTDFVAAHAVITYCMYYFILCRRSPNTYGTTPAGSLHREFVQPPFRAEVWGAFGPIANQRGFRYVHVCTTWP